MIENNGKPRPPETLQILARDLASGGERDALVSFAGEDIRRRSFRELAAEVDACARMLAAQGVGADDPVILCGSGGPDWIVACLALLRCGARVLPVHTPRA